MTHIRPLGLFSAILAPPLVELIPPRWCQASRWHCGACPRRRLPWRNTAQAGRKPSLHDERRVKSRREQPRMSPLSGRLECASFGSWENAERASNAPLRTARTTCDPPRTSRKPRCVRFSCIPGNAIPRTVAMHTLWMSSRCNHTC